MHRFTWCFYRLQSTDKKRVIQWIGNQIYAAYRTYRQWKSATKLKERWKNSQRPQDIPNTLPRKFLSSNLKNRQEFQTGKLDPTKIRFVYSLFQMYGKSSLPRLLSPTFPITNLPEATGNKPNCLQQQTRYRLLRSSNPIDTTCDVQWQLANSLTKTSSKIDLLNIAHYANLVWRSSHLRQYVLAGGWGSRWLNKDGLALTAFLRRCPL